MDGHNLTDVRISPRDDVTYNITSFDRNFLHWSFIVLEVVAIVVIVIGDISVLMLFFTRKLLGQSTNILVFSLAIGDLLTGLLTFPLAMLQKIMYEPSEFLCKGYFYFANVSKTAVSYTILLLAMERIAAVLSHTFRILPPGRCLFFASLTWFFSAAYNIWSVVIYDMETVTVNSDEPYANNAYTLCFASTRFMYLHAIFEFLNPLVTFAFPVIFSSVLFVGFWCKKEEADKPGRPYKSSRSVVIFTLALLISFIVTQLPWEIANLVFIHNASSHTATQLMVLKILHIISFSRGFWDIFIFGAFRRYVCNKEKALAHFREQRSLQVQRSSLAIPMVDRPASLSLLDSDPSVSRRYSSDCTISRRPSGMEESCMVMSTRELRGGSPTNNGDHHNATLLEPAQDRVNPTVTTTIISENCLIPRSPCHHDTSRRFSFAHPHVQLPRDIPLYGDQLHVPSHSHHRNSVSVHSGSRGNGTSKGRTKTKKEHCRFEDTKSQECLTLTNDDSSKCESNTPLLLDSRSRGSIERRKSAPGGHASREVSDRFALPIIHLAADDVVLAELNEDVPDRQSPQKVFLETNFDVDNLTPKTTCRTSLKYDFSDGKENVV